MSHYHIGLYFNEETSEKIGKVRSNLRANGISMNEKDRPYVSLHSYESRPTVGFEHELLLFARNSAPFEIVLSRYHTWNMQKTAIHLKADSTPQLFGVRQRFFDSFSKYKDTFDRPSYLYCTLCSGLSYDMGKRAQEILVQNTLPIRGIIERIGIEKWGSDKPLSVFEFGI